MTAAAPAWVVDMADQSSAPVHQKLTFEGDTALWTMAIKPDKTADFEQIMKKLQEALLKSADPAATPAGCGLEGDENLQASARRQYCVRAYRSPGCERRRLYDHADTV